MNAPTSLPLLPPHSAKGLSRPGTCRSGDPAVSSSNAWLGTVVGLLSITVALFGGPKVQAADRYYDTGNGADLQGGIGTWSAAGLFWSTSATPGGGGGDPRVGWVAGDNAFFQTLTTNTVTVVGTIDALGITQTGVGTITDVSGGTALQIRDGGLTNSGNGLFTINTAVQLTDNQIWTSTSGGGNIVVNGGIDNGGFTLGLAGSGTTTITGAGMTGAGTVNLTGGTLLANNTGLTSATGTGSIATAASTILGGSGRVAPGAGQTFNLSGTLLVGQDELGTGQDFEILLSATDTIMNLSGSSVIEMDLFGGFSSGIANTPLTDNDLLSFAGSFGTLNLAGTLQVNDIGTPLYAAGSSWQLFIWDPNMTLKDSFTNVLLPALSGDLFWDTSALYSTGFISIAAIPEPSKAGLVGLGLLASVLRRRRPAAKRA